MHPESLALLNHLLQMRAEEGEKKTFAYAKQLVQKDRISRWKKCLGKKQGKRGEWDEQRKGSSRDERRRGQHSCGISFKQAGLWGDRRNTAHVGRRRHREGDCRCKTGGRFHRDFPWDTGLQRSLPYLCGEWFYRTVSKGRNPEPLYRLQPHGKGKISPG